MMRSAMQRAQRNIAPRAIAAIRSLRPIAFAYLADRVYGG